MSGGGDEGVFEAENAIEQMMLSQGLIPSGISTIVEGRGISTLNTQIQLAFLYGGLP